MAENEERKSFGEKVDAFFGRVKKNPLPYLLGFVALCIVGAVAVGWIHVPGIGGDEKIYIVGDKELTADEYRVIEQLKSAGESTPAETEVKGDEPEPADTVEEKLFPVEGKGLLTREEYDEYLKEQKPAGDEQTTTDGKLISAAFPTLTVVDGREISDWEDPEYVGLSERIVLRNDELVIQGSANARKGTITWDSLRNTDQEFQEAYFGADENRLGEFLINKISFWAGSVLRYENEDGDEIALLVKVDELDYRLWRITDDTRSIPSSKDDLYDVQYVYETALTETRTTTTETTDRGYTSRDIADTGSSDSGTSTRGYTSRT